MVAGYLVSLHRRLCRAKFSGGGLIATLWSVTQESQSEVIGSARLAVLLAAQEALRNRRGTMPEEMITVTNRK